MVVLDPGKKTPVCGIELDPNGGVEQLYDPCPRRTRRSVNPSYESLPRRVEISGKQLMVESHSAMNTSKMNKFRRNFMINFNGKQISLLEFEEKEIEEYRRILNPSEFLASIQINMQTLLNRYHFYSQEKILRLKFDSYVSFDKALERLVCKEFDVNNKEKPLIIAGSWAAPRKGNSFKDKIRCSPTVGSAKKILCKLKTKGFEVDYCYEGYTTQTCHRCLKVGLKCLKSKSKKNDENPYEALRILADTASMAEENSHDDLEDDINEKPSELQNKNEKKKKKKYKNRRLNIQEKKEIMKEKNGSSLKSPGTSTTNIMEKVSNNEKENPHGIVLDKKKPYFKTIRCLLQCRSKECHGRIFCRDLQSSKTLSWYILHGRMCEDHDGDRFKYKYKRKKRKKNLDDDAENNNLEEGKMKKKQKTSSSSSDSASDSDSDSESSRTGSPSSRYFFVKSSSSFLERFAKSSASRIAFLSALSCISGSLHSNFAKVSPIAAL